ncbi:hypothetical protein AAFF_G00384520 [Aldrovandia affinis]|uniref:Uncharacterized protein n=1 Tax=Aldrovandia affinis TaxID=143900 RepID=A0AAD7R4R6_9TELE|nr:hypothetical protein AAFF_G00384520 [Aldrovandia affinis]
MEEIVLATLNCATTVMSMETKVSNIYPIIFSLLKTHLLRSEDDSRRVGQFKSKVRQSLSTRMGVEQTKPSLIASIFDPRHKHLRFLTPMERAAAKEKLQEIVTTLEVTTDVPITDKPAAATTSGDEETAVPAAPKVLIIKNLKSKSPAEVADIFNVSKRQVERIRKRYQETGDVHDSPSYSSQDLQTSQIPTRKAEEHCLPPSCSTTSPCSAPPRSYTLPSCPTQPQKTPPTITNG